MDGLRQGSLTAFERLYREQSSRMKSIAANLLGNFSEAEDAVHDTFVKVFRAAGSFDGRCPVDCWVIRILVNHCHDKLRQRRPTEPPADFLRPSREDHPLRYALEQAIARLPERQRAVFLLYEVEGFRQQEIAAVLEMNEGTVRSTLFTARQTLRGILRPVQEAS